MKIKVCGMKQLGNIQAVADLKPDYMGFIFYGRSPRYIGELPSVDMPDLQIIKTGVFVDAPFGQMVELIAHYQLDAVQLHGLEHPSICRALKEERPIIEQKIVDVTRRGKLVKKESSVTETTITLQRDVQVIKAFGVNESFDFEQLTAYADVVDYFLFDTKTPAHGGSGKSFDWALLNNYKLNVPFFLSGGLSLENLAEVKNIKHPAFYGVDLNSKFEIAPGVKDIYKLKQAFELLNT